MGLFSEMMDETSEKDQEISRLRAALDDIAIACEKRAHPAGPVVISELHVEDMRSIAARARYALCRVPSQMRRENPSNVGKKQ